MRYLYIVLIFSCAGIYAFGSASVSIHPFTESASFCSPCHEKDIKKITDPSKACAEYCRTCHGPMDAHHPVNLRISHKLPDNFLLTGNKRITCITCHNVKNERFDTSPWKSESLYENIFKSSTKYKTYFLVKKNNEGQLCKVCH